LNCRGNVLRHKKSFDAALDSYDRGLALRPDSAEVLCNRGIVLRELKRFDEALASYDRALAIRPDYADALNSRGIVLRELGRLDEALANVDRALAIRPGFAEALTSRGTTLIELKRLDEALASFRRAQAVRPDYADAHWGESFCQLLAGDFGAGWEKYEWRWRTGQAALRQFLQPLWLGDQDVAGKTVLLHAEQGNGDTIQFCRYATVLAERGARVVLEVQPALKSLLSCLIGVQQVVATGEPLPEFDFHCPLLSLPLACGTTLQTIPARVPYLTPAPGLVQDWRTRLATDGPRIGLAWSGNKQHGNDRNRSIALRRLAPLLDCGATLVSLQKGPRDDDRAWLAEHPEVLRYSDFPDFADTAALISLLDLVISVDTSVAHLAGAMGKPVWILLPAVGLDWRWLLERDDSPWYPTARLFRQRAIGDWDSVINRVADELRKRFGGG
jgi:Flp pilus assembly protein TadD